MVNRRPEQTRRRIAQTASRLHSLAHPAAVAPDELLVSERTGRISRDAAQALAYRPAEIGETLRPAVGDVLVPARRDRPGRVGRPARRARLGQRLRGDALPRRRARPGAGEGRRLRPHDRAARHAGRARGARAGDGLQRPDGPARPVPAPPRPHRAHLAGAGRRPLAARARTTPPRLARAGLALLDPEAWELAWDFEALHQLAEEPGLDPSWAGRLLAELDRFARTFVAADRATLAGGARDPRRPARAPQRRQRARGDRDRPRAHRHRVAVAARRDAAARSCARRRTSSRCMDRYPEHRFAALLSAALRVARAGRAGALRAACARRCARAAGRSVGGSGWSPTATSPSGESLVRQLLYGQRVLRGSFGAAAREFWSPDTFGYNGQLPQILRGAGIDRS